MLSLSECKCQRDVTGCNGIMPDAQCRSAYNNGNERRNTVYANTRTSLRIVRYETEFLDLEMEPSHKNEIKSSFKLIILFVFFSLYIYIYNLLIIII